MGTHRRHCWRERDAGRGGSNSERGVIASPAPAVRICARCRPSRSPARCALTLVELLVVIVIMSTLVATIIPLMVPTVENQRVREAARGVQTFFSSARSRALERGRPVGVLIERLSSEVAGEPADEGWDWSTNSFPGPGQYVDLNGNGVYDGSGAGITLYYVEVPPPFSGYTTDAAARVTGANLLSLVVKFGASSGQNWVDQNIPPDFLRPGDTIQFNYQGNVYQFTDTTPANIDANGYYQGNNLQISLISGTGAVPASFTAGSPPMPYQILRQPQRSSAPPYQLPEGTVIDLYASGFDADFFHDPLAGKNRGDPLAGGKNNGDPIVIMFSSTGALDRVIYNVHDESQINAVTKPYNGRATGTIHLLIGKRENVPAPTAASVNTGRDDEEITKTANWWDLDNVWVSIGHQTGQVGTAEMAPQRFFPDTIDTTPPPDPYDRTDDRTMINQILDARRFAREMRTMGGR